MTDRHAGYLVTLEKDIREDDAEETVHALLMIKGVIGVTPITSDINLGIAEIRARTEILDKVIGIFRPS